MAEDKSRRAAWCKVCDDWRQTWPDQLESVEPPKVVLYIERCMSCDSVCKTSKEPREADGD